MALVELLTTLDLRVRGALEGLEEMRRSLGALDERIDRDVDELRTLVRAKLDEIELDSMGARFDRLEAAILNIERATVHLDESFQSGLEALPDFVTKRLRPS